MSEIVGQGISRENLEGAFNNFIDRISNDEKLREELAADPLGVLESWGLNQEEINSIRHSPAWAWLRDSWDSLPPGW